MVQAPTPKDIASARQVFDANEPRDLFYRAATELVTLALEGKTSLSVTEALPCFYRFRQFFSDFALEQRYDFSAKAHICCKKVFLAKSPLGAKFLALSAVIFACIQN
ncbi:MAG: hypothetical protein WHS87_07635 [Anaerolineales bacterium]